MIKASEKDSPIVTNHFSQSLGKGLVFTNWINKWFATLNNWKTNSTLKALTWILNSRNNSDLQPKYTGCLNRRSTSSLLLGHSYPSFHFFYSQHPLFPKWPSYTFEVHFVLNILFIKTVFLVLSFKLVLNHLY